MADPMTVVVVDDAPDMRDLVCLLVDSHRPSWQVVGTAENGREGLEVAADTRPDLVLLDVAMPVMDGMQALPLLREALPDAMVVMLSGHPAETAGPPAFEAGAHGYIEKRELLTTLVPELRRIVATVRDSAPTD